ncbi:MAG: tetratricopeptide repeat protein [Hellea sp.]|nr:tetratricopeptide repeat protein [Hellea sp.]
MPRWARYTACRLLPKLVGGVSVFALMKRIFLTCLAAMFAALPAQAQITDLPNFELPNVFEAPADETKPEDERKDYAHLPPKAEKQARLDDLFIKLRDETDADTANLIAEEIWAHWLQSGSASVDLLIRRATAAATNGKTKLARRLYDQILVIEPDYAEAWARSGRLALDNGDYNRAVVEVSQALVIEPRHFYALWTLGNILESLERQDEALAVYSEAHKLYPALEIVKKRKEYLETRLQGEIL